MFQLPYNGEHVSQLAHEMLVLGLPSFTGVAKLTRELDQDGKVILVNGKPKIVTAYLLVKSGALSSAQEAAVTTVVSNHVRSLAPERDVLRRAVVAEGVTRIGIQVPEWDSFERVAFVVSIANLLNSANLNAAQTLARDIYLYVKNTALPKLATITTQAGLDAIDPTAADPFGDGTPWPT